MKRFNVLDNVNGFMIVASLLVSRVGRISLYRLLQKKYAVFFCNLNVFTRKGWSPCLCNIRNIFDTIYGTYKNTRISQQY